MAVAGTSALLRREHLRQRRSLAELPAGQGNAPTASGPGVLDVFFWRRFGFIAIQKTDRQPVLRVDRYGLGRRFEAARDADGGIGVQRPRRPHSVEDGPGARF